MAAITPSNTLKLSVGPAHLYCYKFAGTADTADTFVSGNTGILTWWISQADGNTTQASAGVGATESSGTFTFALGEDNTAFHLFVVAKGS